METGAGEFLCPRGHSSAEPEFCSVCGARMAGTDAAAGRQPGDAEPFVCPDCGTARGGEFGGVFCEICGFNYRTGAHGEIATAEVPAEARVESSMAGAEPDAATAALWCVEVTPCPARTDVPVHTVVLDGQVMLMGRTGGGSGQAPQIDLGFDDGVSRRHALLQRMEDGRYCVRDLASTNGTTVNGQEIPALVDQVLAVGDRITVGRGTTLTIVPGQM